MQHVDQPERTGALQVSLKALIDLLVLIALMVAAALPLLLLIVAADWLFRHGKLTAMDASAGAWGEIILSLGAMALPLAWIARRWRSLEIPAGTTPAAGVVFGLVAGLLAAGISYPIGWLGQWTGNDILPSNTAYVDQLLQGPWLLSLLVLVVVAPVSEEVVFRKFLLARFLKSGHPLLGIALTSVQFGLMHEPFPSGEQSIAGWALLLADYSLAGALFAAPIASPDVFRRPSWPMPPTTSSCASRTGRRFERCGEASASVPAAQCRHRFLPRPAVGATGHGGLDAGGGNDLGGVTRPADQPAHRCAATHRFPDRRRRRARRRPCCSSAHSAPAALRRCCTGGGDVRVPKRLPRRSLCPGAREHGAGRLPRALRPTWPVGRFLLWPSGGGGAATNNVALIEAGMDACPALLFVFAILMAPVYEELVFRRILFGRLWSADRPAMGWS